MLLPLLVWSRVALAASEIQWKKRVPSAPKINSAHTSLPLPFQESTQQNCLSISAEMWCALQAPRSRHRRLLMTMLANRVYTGRVQSIRRSHAVRRSRHATEVQSTAAIFGSIRMTGRIAFLVFLFFSIGIFGQTQAQKAVCDNGRGQFETQFATGVSVRVGAGQSGAFATRMCNALLAGSKASWWQWRAPRRLILTCSARIWAWVCRWLRFKCEMPLATGSRPI